MIRQSFAILIFVTLFATAAVSDETRVRVFSGSEFALILEKDKNNAPKGLAADMAVRLQGGNCTVERLPEHALPAQLRPCALQGAATTGDRPRLPPVRSAIGRPIRAACRRAAWDAAASRSARRCPIMRQIPGNARGKKPCGPATTQHTHARTLSSALRGPAMVCLHGRAETFDDGKIIRQ